MKVMTYSSVARSPMINLSGGMTKLCLPAAQSNSSCHLLGETGCRLAEIVGLRLEDIDLDNDLIHIRPNSARRLKNKTSERVLPLVGYAKLAIEQAQYKADDEWLFPQYIKSGHCYATHASNAVNKWLKKESESNALFVQFIIKKVVGEKQQNGAEHDD